MPNRRSRPSLLHALDVLSNTCRRFALPSLTARVDDVIEYSSQTDQVDVVVLGRFKSGKSSLLNALLGRNVLPIDVLPATAVITRVASGTQDSATVVNENGHETRIEMDVLRRYVTEKENPNNVKRVARVDVKVAGLDRLAGLRLVDTPGVGSIHRHNTEATEQWLPRVGAVLLAISVDQPLSDHDVTLLQDLRSFTPFVTIVLTKTDLVDPDQLDTVREYVAHETEERLGRYVPVVPVSTRPGHEGRLEELRSFLDDAIAKNRTDTAEAILDHKVRVLADTCRDYLGVALRAARAGAQTRMELRCGIEEERRNIGLIYKELSLVGGYMRERALNETEERFLAHRGDLARGLQSQMTQEAIRWKGNLAREARTFRAWLGEALHAHLARISSDERDSWRGLIEEADVAVNRLVRAFKDRLSGKVREALGVEFVGVTFEARPEAPKRPSLHLGQVFDTHIDSLWFMVPMAIFRPLVHRQFRLTIAWEIEKHLYRLASQWSEAIGRSIEAIAAQGRDYVRCEIDTLVDLLSRATDDSADIEAAIVNIEQIPGIDGRPMPQSV
jgi:GTPase Era involved in 16S rRNA processing